MSGNVKWYGTRVRAEIKGATDSAIAKLALDIEAGTKQAITDNGQIDTGFMRNSTYSVTKASGIHGGGAPQIAGRKAAQMAPLGDSDAIVGVGAVYAIYNEVKKSFLRISFERAVANAGGTFRQVFQRKGF